ncbi:DUF4367 domain-containing protein [Methanolobus sp. ZRKC2]|uniref:DUF4367 domain-containing protein n=1 Tax=Methanolobus sp. ZRKC2 TaxID=3125783 RepID=UPI003254D539
MKTGLFFVLLLIGIALFSSGCTDEELSAERIAEKMQEKQANIKDYSATIHVTTSFEGQVQKMEYEIIQKNPEKTKITIKQPDEFAGSISVCNGKNKWEYNPSTNIVEVWDNFKVLETSEFDYANMFKDILEESDVAIVGVEEFNDRNTYVITVKSKEKRDEENYFAYDMKAWVDEETWIPLKYESTMTRAKEGEYRSTVEYQNFKTNTGIRDEEFEFEIPNGAEVRKIGDAYAILKSTLEESEFDFLIPSYMPEGYELEHTFFNDESSGVPDKGALTLIYSNGENEIFVSETFYEEDNGLIPIPSKRENISINGVDAKFVADTGHFRKLQWKTNNTLMIIDANLEKEEIIRIAKSMQE